MLIALLICGFALLAAVTLLFASAEQAKKPCPCCGKRLPTFGHATCYECRSTQVNKR
jgi:hypothetical protein